ncbi:Uncharacterised protein [Weeksella virosa]|nr:Uncharacterised protein [Weeksella virosa]VEH64486.1 Uncharacterised protein [Weeksella virosa]
MNGKNGEKFMSEFNMIKQINRKNLDQEKYTKCLRKSVNYRVYAEIWYLDLLVNKRWDCLVYGDYQAVMPLPFIRLLGMKFVSQPTYCQQLGVFHSDNFPIEVFQRIYRKLEKKRVKSYHFNEENTLLFSPQGEKRINHILPVNNREYDKKTKKNVRSFINKKVELRWNSVEIDELINFKQKNSQHAVDIQQLFRVLTILQEKKKATIITAHSEGELVGFSVFIDSGQRGIYVNASVNNQGKKMAVPTGILDAYIQENPMKILDFEGSNIPSIAHFFEGFGAQKKYYTCYKNNRLW